MVVRRCLVAAGRQVARTWSPRELPSAPRCASSGVRHVGAGVETPTVDERQRHHPRGGNHPFLRCFVVPAPRGYASSPSTAGEAAAPGLQTGSLVVVALRDSAKSPRRLAVVKGPAAGPGGYILLEMDAHQEVAVRPQSIKMALPPPSSADGDAMGAARCDPDIIALIIACAHCGQRSGSSAFACRRLSLLLSYFTPSAALGSGGKWDVEGMKRVRERASELRVNIYVCMFIRMYVHTHTHTHVHIYMYVYVYTCTRMCVYIGCVVAVARLGDDRMLYICTYVCMHACMCVRVRVCARARVCVCACV
jgi:hypothetical protein